jgi:hypothetical protein
MKNLRPASWYGALMVSLTVSAALGQGAGSGNDPPPFDELPEAIQQEILRLRGADIADPARDADAEGTPEASVPAHRLGKRFILVEIVNEDGSRQTVEY